MFGNNTLSVRLLSNGNNAMKVVVCPDALKLEDGPVQWVKGEETRDFRFVTVQIDEVAFPNPRLVEEGDGFEVQNNAHKTGYFYTVIVEDTESGQIYDTEKLSCEDSEEAYVIVPCSPGDAPVIRPK